LDALKQALANNCENVRTAVKENDHLRLQLRLYTAPVEKRVLALSAFEGMGIATIEPPIKFAMETECETAKLLLSSPSAFSEDEKKHFWPMMDTSLDIPPVERHETEPGNGRACLELSIEPGSSYMVEPEDSEPDRSGSLPLDDQIVYPPPLGLWIEDDPPTPG
jgi:hypothetical protein